MISTSLFHQTIETDNKGIWKATGERICSARRNWRLQVSRYVQMGPLWRYDTDGLRRVRINLNLLNFGQQYVMVYAGYVLGFVTYCWRPSPPRSASRPTRSRFCEPYLLIKGCLYRTPRGRMATPRGYEHLGDRRRGCRERCSQAQPGLRRTLPAADRSTIALLGGHGGTRLRRQDFSS
jgi:hypothetical protein